MSSFLFLTLAMTMLFLSGGGEGKRGEERRRGGVEERRGGAKVRIH